MIEICAILTNGVTTMQEFKTSDSIIQEPLIPEEIAQIILDAFSIKTDLPIGLWQQGDHFALTASSEKKFESMCQYLRDIGHDNKCKQDHIERAKKVKEFGPTICHLGLTNWAMPIFLDGQKVAVLLYGQKKSHNKEDDKESNEFFKKNLPCFNLTKEQEKEVKRLFKKAKRFKEPRPEIENLDKVTQWLYSLINEKINLKSETIRLQRETNELNNKTQNLEYEKLVCETDKKEIEKEKKKVEEYVETVIHEIVIALQANMADFENFLNYSIPRNEEKIKIEAKDLLHSMLRVRIIVLNLGLYLGGYYNFKEYDIRKILEESKKTYEAFANKRKIKIMLHTSFRDPIISISPLHIQHAVNNLVHNAIKYSYSGAKYENKERYIEVSGEPIDGYYMITIKNFGIGILPEEIDKIFEKGYKGILTRDEMRTGGGYGLATVKDIIDSHNGKIEVKSIKQKKGDNIYKGKEYDDKKEDTPYLTIINVFLPNKKLEV